MRRHLDVWSAVIVLMALGGSQARAGGEGAAAGRPRGGPARVVDLVADFGAGESSDLTDPLQQAVDQVGAAGGGTIVIPARKGGWRLGRPIFVGYPNVTIRGQGCGTYLHGTGGTMFLLGMRRQYDPPITAGHLLPVGGPAGLLDKSVKRTRYGLRTFDGKTSASGWFSTCPLSHGAKVPRHPSGSFWKDYEIGTGKPTFWANAGCYTINLAVINHSAGAMAGTICGVGPGGLTRALTQGNIDDPLNVWTIESDPATGRNLCFRFRTVGEDGRESVHSLPLAAGGAGAGLHRIGVQLDFTTGRCRSWYSASAREVVAPVLAGRLDLPKGHGLKAFEYGAFRLGRVVASPFDGSPADGKGGGDWTCCGLSLFERARYAVGGPADRLGAPQLQAEANTPADDAYRFFPPVAEGGLLTFLPLESNTPQVMVPYQDGKTFDDGRGGWGYWMPGREVTPLEGTIALKDMYIDSGGHGSGTAILVGETSHVVLEGIQNFGGCVQTVGNLNCGLTGGVLEIRDCRILGSDASVYCHSMTVRVENVAGGGGELMFRFAGCRGYVDTAMVTGFVRADYYVKLHAGAVGGPMRFSQFCVDNEGCSYVPLKAVLYAEPSLDGGKEGNRLHIAGTLYTGSLLKSQSVIELADPPGPAGQTPKAAGELRVDGIDLWFPKDKLGSVVLCRGAAWSGKLMAQSEWSGRVRDGLVHCTGPGRCGLVACQESYALPTAGAWTEGCHLVRVPDRQDAATGAWRFKTFRCVRSGVYGTDNEPRWRQVKEPAR